MNEKQINARVSEEMKKILDDYAKQTELGISPLIRISLCMLFQELRMLEESLKDINKNLADMCPLYEKRYSNFALYPLKRLINMAPEQDKFEILIAIEKTRSRKEKQKQKEINSLQKLNMGEDEDEE